MLQMSSAASLFSLAETVNRQDFADCVHTTMNVRAGESTMIQRLPQPTSTGKEISNRPARSVKPKVSIFIPKSRGFKILTLWRVARLSCERVFITTCSCDGFLTLGLHVQTALWCQWITFTCALPR